MISLLFLVVLFGLSASGLVFGWVGAAMAREAELSRHAGFILGLTLGPLGLMVVSYQKPNTSPSRLTRKTI